MFGCGCDIVAAESIRFWVYFSRPLPRKVPKEAAARNPFAKGFLTYPPKEVWVFALSMRENAYPMKYDGIPLFLGARAQKQGDS